MLFSDFFVSNWKIVLIFLFTLFTLFLIYYFLNNFFVNKFKDLLKEVVEDFFDESIKNKKNYNREDSLSKNKKKEKEQERVQEVEVEVLKKKEAVSFAPKIKGFSFYKVLGKFTSKIVENFMQNFKGLDPKDLQEKGYYQANEIAKSGSRSRGSDGSFRNL